jgi:hypothetical protein
LGISDFFEVEEHLLESVKKLFDLKFLTDDEIFLVSGYFLGFFGLPFCLVLSIFDLHFA